MREIKFRAWDEPNKEMIYNPDEIPIFYDEDNGFHSGYEFPNGHIQEGDWVELKLMQYTGLKDKNGKEIYYGDIVSKYHDDDDEENDFRVVEQLQGHTEIGCFSYYESSEDFTVIGNIHENPDLL